MHILSPGFAPALHGLRGRDTLAAHHGFITKGSPHMKSSAIVCTLLATTLGFSTLASAQDWNGRRDHDRNQRAEQRHDGRQDQRRDDRARHWERNNAQRSYSQPSYVYSQPSYGYQAPRHYANSHFYRGGSLPYEYRQQQYYVNNWNAYPGLYAPPYGYQWVQVGSDFALVALATGLIANLLTQ
jgi:Ni/Co efflux regulator RcnB